MSNRIRSIFIYILACCVIILIASCSGSSTPNKGDITPLPTGSVAPPPTGGSGWPAGIPADTVQPWERRDPAAVNVASEFNPGAQRWLESGSTVEEGDALSLASGSPGNDSLSWAAYRLVMAGQQPGVISTDINLKRRADGAVSAYYIGVADYDSLAWDWHGPFQDNHVRLSTVAGNYLTGAGNTIVAIVAHDGAEFDVVGIGVNPRDPGDTTPPAAPAALGATPFAGALLLEWTGVAAADLAGYAVYFSDTDFTDPDAPGVMSLGYLVGETECALRVSELGPLTVHVAAVDISGNMSGLSSVAVAQPLAGEPPAVVLATDVCGGTFNVVANLYASGADNYDWDLDGDGLIDISGDTTGTQVAQTSRTGIIRPHVYGYNGGGESRACGAVSLVVTGNTRPVARALAAPPQGPAPLTTTLVGEGVDFDDGDSIADYSWDFDSDGTYDISHPTDPNVPGVFFPFVGVYSAKLRVTDTHGAWDVDTVTISVIDPENDPPVALFTPSTTTGGIGTMVSFDASASNDPGPTPGGGIVRYYWDFGHGYFERATAGPVTNYTYTAAGVYNVVLAVEDTHGVTADTMVQVTIINTAPIANLTANHLRGAAPHQVTFDASLSIDAEGNIETYDWDFNGDGIYDSTGTSPQVTHTYPQPGVYLCQLLITDAGGLTDTETAEITATGWHTTTVVSGQDAWITCAGMEADGYPALVYEDTTPFPVNVMYVRALDAYGMRWGTPIDIGDTSTYSAQRLNLEDIGGNPAVVYISDTGFLKYIRATDAAGTAWGTPVNVDASPNRTESADLEMVDGRPAVISLDRATWDIAYNRASDATGATWPASGITLPKSGSPSYGCTLEVIESRPCVAYMDSSGMNLYFVRAADSTGSAWGSTVQVVSGDCFNGYSLNPYSDGFTDIPAIMYNDYNSGGLKVRLATDLSGATWNAAYEIDANYYAGWSVTMQQGSMVGNVAAYYEAEGGALWFTDEIDTNMASPPYMIDNAGDTGGACTMFTVGASVGIVYLEFESDDLRYAQLIR